MEILEKLPPSFQKDGIVTAGNASGIVDGAAACGRNARANGEEQGLKPVRPNYFLAVAGVDPSIMGSALCLRRKKLSNLLAHARPDSSLASFAVCSRVYDHSGRAINDAASISGGPRCHLF